MRQTSVAWSLVAALVLSPASWRTDASAAEADSQDVPLYLLTYDHAVGYPQIQDEARKTAAQLEANPEWKSGGQIEGWTWDWLAKNDPAFLAQARGWITKYPGRWVPAGGSYGQPYFTFISEESGIRQMFYGTRAIKERLGYDNDIYVYSEHEVMPQMPQVLAGMGYRGAVLRTHMQYGGDGPACDADWVRWTGPDGSAIPAVPAYSGLEQCLGNMWLMTGYGGWSNWSKLEGFKDEMRRRGVRNPIISRCDDWGSRANPQLLAGVKAHPKTAHWVTAPEYFDVLERSGIQPAVFQAGPNDFNPQQPWGYCGNRTWTGPRVASAQALTAEALAVTAILNGFAWTPAHQSRLDEAWKNLLIAEHHDTMIVAIFNEGRYFLDPSRELSAGLAKEMAQFLAAGTQARGEALFVFNPTGHPRTDTVVLKAPGPVRVIAPDGTAVATAAGVSGACFVARDIPALGYKVYRIEPGAPAAASQSAPAEAKEFETGRYQVSFGPEGGLVKLRDKLTGKDVMPEGPRTGVLEGVIDGEVKQSHGQVKLPCQGAGVWQAVETGTVGAVGYEMVYTFTADNVRIDLDIRLDIPKGTLIGRPNDPKRRGWGGQWDHGAKLRYVFNASLEDMMGKGPRAARHQPLIVQTAGAGEQTLDANLWASVETERSGLAITNAGSMGYRAVGTSLEAILAYSGQYNWGGQKLLEGPYAYRYAIVPYGGYSLNSYCMHEPSYGGIAPRAMVHRQAVERDRPLYVLAFQGQGGKGPLAGSAVELPKMDDAVTVQALFPQDGRLFLRLINMGEKPMSVALPGRVAAINMALTKPTPVDSPLLLHPWRAQTYEMAPKTP